MRKNPGMRAARLVVAGSEPRFQLHELEEPTPTAGEVVVDLVTAALNRRDWWLWRAADTPVPVTLGSDGAGRVALVGEDVVGISPGDEVVIDPTLGWGDDEGSASDAFDILGSPTEGTFAERVAVPAANVHAKPAALTWEEAAAFPLAGLTAWRAVVTCARAAPGRRVLVTGGGSGVSTFCVQIACALGAEVWVTSGHDAKIARCVELGARGGFRYDDPEWPAQVLAATDGEGMHAVVDSYAGEGWAKALDALARGGVLVNYGDTGGAEATIPVASLYWQWRSLVGTTMGSPSEFRALCDHLATAAWRPAIDSVYAMEDITAAAGRLIAPSRFGKVVLRITRTGQSGTQSTTSVQSGCRLRAASTVRSPASSCALAMAASTPSTKWNGASACQPSGAGRCDTTTTWSIPLGGVPPQPSVRSKTWRPTIVTPIWSQYARV